MPASPATIRRVVATSRPSSTRSRVSARTGRSSAPRRTRDAVEASEAVREATVEELAETLPPKVAQQVWAFLREDDAPAPGDAEPPEDEGAGA